MTSHPVDIRTEMELRIIVKNDVKIVDAVLSLLRKAGGDLKAHILYRVGDHLVGLFIIDKPTEGALALAG